MSAKHAAEADPPSVGVAGVGVIGRAWIKVFVRAGCRVSVFDAEAAQAQQALAGLHDDLMQEVDRGAIGKERAEELFARVSIQPLDKAFQHVRYVQESGPESLEVKRSLFAELDRFTCAAASIGSSTSAIDVNVFAGHLPGAGRMLTVHPISPPSLNPAVEVFPCQAVPAQVLEDTLAFLRQVGMAPVLMKKFIYGYISARLQAALMREAINLVDKGYATMDGVDTMVREGLGQRWAFLGPFAVNHLNANGGVREYYTKYADTYINLMQSLFDEAPSFDRAMAERFGAEADRAFGTDVAGLRRWRDEQMRLLRENKDRLPQPGPASSKPEPA